LAVDNVMPRRRQTLVCYALSEESTIALQTHGNRL